MIGASAGASSKRSACRPFSPAGSMPIVSPPRSPSWARPVSIRKPKPISPTALGKTLRRSGSLSPPPSSPAEGGRPQLDDAIILDDAQQLEPALQPRRAALTLVALRFGNILRIPNDRLAALCGVRQRSPRIGGLLCRGRQRRTERRGE